MKFKVGDKVKILENCEYTFKGKVGTVQSIDDKFVYVEGIQEDFPEASYACYPNEIELVEQEKTVKFKVGDKVKVISGGWSFTGQTLTVVGVEDEYVLSKGVLGDEDYTWHLFHNYLELVGEKKPALDKKTGYVKAKITKKGNIQLTMSEDMALILRIIVGSVTGSNKSPRVKADEFYREMVKVTDNESAWGSPEFNLVENYLHFEDYLNEDDKA